MTATLAQLRTNLQTRLATTGLTVFTEWPEGAGLSPPCLIIGEVNRGEAEALGEALTSYDVKLTLILPATPLQAQQQALDTYLEATGSTSIPAAIAADRTLGDIGTCSFEGFQDAGLVEINGYKFLGGLITLKVWL